jgi:BirA family biotin operon repressor/biotin-[acetyl-CoA-carboxylase] ligase
MIAGLACAEAVESYTGLRPGLKWPNDLLLHGRKLAGILTELESAAGQLAFAVVGMGINVNVDFRQALVPAELRETGIGLSQALGHPVDRLDLLREVLLRLEQRYEGILSGRSPHLEWSERLISLGEQVRVTTMASEEEVQGQVLEGRAEGVDRSGALLLRLADGRLRAILAGDVTLRRSL